MNVIEQLRKCVRQQIFHPKWLGLVFNPAYIIRKGLLQAIMEFAPHIRGQVLDFGCGSKPYESLFYLAESYIGVDIAASGHMHTDSKIDVFYDGSKLPFSDAQFDAIVSFEVFEHVFNLGEVLSEINRVTKEGGFLLISIPFAWEEHEIPYDYARYTSYGISNTLRAHGYNVIKLRKTSTYVLAISQIAISYMSRVIPDQRLLRNIGQVGLIFPATAFAYVLNALLPKRYEYFCGCVILAQKGIDTNP